MVEVRAEPTDVGLWIPGLEAWGIGMESRENINWVRGWEGEGVCFLKVRQWIRYVWLFRKSLSQGQGVLFHGLVWLVITTQDEFGTEVDANYICRPPTA